MSAPSVMDGLLETLGLVEADRPLVLWQTWDTDDGWTTHDARSAGLISYTIVYGRTDARSKLTPLQVTVRVARQLAGDAPEVSDPFRLAITPDAAAELGLTDDDAARFTGEITDVQIDPASKTWTVIGVGTLAREGRQTLDMVAAGTQTAHDRAAAVLAAVTANVGTVDADESLLAGPDDLATASQLLDQVTDSTFGLTVQQLDGSVDWHAPEHRRGAAPAVTLTPAEILSALTWAQHIGSVINIAKISYVGGDYTATDHASAELRGEYPSSLSTVLLDPGEARGLGSSIVGRFGSPSWDLPVLQVDLTRTVDAANLPALLALRFGDRLTIDDLPDDGPITGDFDFFLEGITETAVRGAWRFALAISDPALSGISLRWMDVHGPTFAPVTLDGGSVSAAGPYAVTVDGGDVTAVGAADLEWEAVYHTVRWIDVARMEHATELGPFTRTYDGGMAA